MNLRLLSSLTAVVVILSACAVTADRPSPTLPPVTDTVFTSTTTTSTLATEVAVTRFRDCLAEQGLEIEEISVDATGRPRFDLMLAGLDFSDQEQIDAIGACREHVLGGPLDLTGSPELRSEVIALLSEFAACVRDRGVKGFPDPRPDFDGAGFPFPTGEIPYEDPGLSSAVEICRTRLVSPSS